MAHPLVYHSSLTMNLNSVIFPKMAKKSLKTGKNKLNNMREILLGLLFSYIFVSGAFAQEAAYLTADSEPWDKTAILQAFTTVYGSEGTGWSKFIYGTSASTIFTSGRKLVFIEGGNTNTSMMKDFLNDNWTSISTWVNQGNSLIVDAATNEDLGNFEIGSSGIFSNRVLLATMVAASPTHPILLNAAYPAYSAGNYSGNFVAHNVITGSYSSSIFTCSGGNTMVEKTMGLGRMIVSGCTLPWYYAGNSGWNPQPQMQNLLNSLLSWAKDLSSISVRRVITISTVNLSKTYGSDYTFSGTEFILKGALAPGESITHVDLTSNGASASAGIGNFEISAENATGDGGFLASNYDIKYTSAGKLTVDPSELTITADAGQSKVYGETDPRFTFTASGFKNGQDVSVISGSLSRVAGENPGTYSFTPGDLASMDYTINILPAKFTVTKALLTVTAENKSKTYGDINPTLVITYSGFKGSDDKRVLNEVPSVSTTAVKYSSPGIFSITPAGGSDDNYLFTYAEGTLTINKASLTFKADDMTRDYLTSNPEMTFTISGFVNGETRSSLDLMPSIQTDAFQSSNAGTYSITLYGGSDSRYNFIFRDGIMTIDKIPQTITFSGIPEKMLVKDVYHMSASSTSGLPVLFESVNSGYASVLGNECTGLSRGTAEIRAYNPGDQNYLAAEIFADIAIISTHKEILHLFSPNNDGINDKWEIPDLDSYGKCDIIIFNRWGKEVYANKSYDNLWDGTSNGSPLHDGAYYYFIKSQNLGTITGTINIVR